MPTTHIDRNEALKPTHKNKHSNPKEQRKESSFWTEKEDYEK